MPKQAVESHRRLAELKAAQRCKMASSVHAYVRGSTERFYAWLEKVQPRSLPEGPAIWICGDCHVGNIGPIASVHEQVQIGIRDLDQTVIGNPVHDLLRLGLSLAAAARSSNLPGALTVAMLERLIAGYSRALTTDGHKRSAPARPSHVRVVMRRAMHRTWKKLMRERIEDTHPTIPLGANYWPLTRKERSAIKELATSNELFSLVRRLQRRDDDAEVQFMDAAYWKKGCSSLGRLRYALLFEVGSGREESRELCLIDLKEPPPVVAPHAEDANIPAHAGLRVITGAKALTPALGERMLAADLLGRPIFVRELRPQDLKLKLEQLDQAEAIAIAEFLAWTVGHAHAQQLDMSSRRAWKRELGTGNSRSRKAPAWLWNSVVELLGIHEAAYLEHCRRFALETNGN
jgi:uncharacterized protein (DUF2252 family)